MKVYITGMLWHEILGLAIIGIFIVHNLLNLKWIKSISKNILKNKINKKTKFMYILDILLIFLAIITGISGIGISKSILTNIFFENLSLWTYIHNLSAYLLFAGIGIHIGLHLQNIILGIKKGLKITKNYTKNKDTLNNNTFGKIIAIVFSISGVLAYMSDENFKELINFKKNDNTNAKSFDVNVYKASQILIEENNEDYTLVAVTSTDATLEKLLDDTICTGCRKRCPLSSPQCNIGVKQAEELKLEYSKTATNDNSNTTADTTTNTNDTTITDTTTNTNDEIETEIESQTQTKVDTETETKTSTNTSNLNNDLTQTTTLNENSVGSNIFVNLLEIGFWISGTYYVLESSKQKRKKE
jgi:cytochrome b subunit of formate dehydrogenase